MAYSEQHRNGALHPPAVLDERAAGSEQPAPPSLNYTDYLWEGKTFRQRDLTPRVVYDAEYVRTHYEPIEGKVRKLAGMRVNVLEAFVPRAGNLLDYGAGLGLVADVAWARGWRVDKYDVARLPGQISMQTVQSTKWHCVCFFDVLEHLDDPAGVIYGLGAPYVMVSVPWCHHPEIPSWFMTWKHRRPGEHLRHWNRCGLDTFFGELGYEPLMWSSFEDDVRERYDPNLPNILTAIYRRRQPVANAPLSTNPAA